MLRYWRISTSEKWVFFFKYKLINFILNLNLVFFTFTYDCIFWNDTFAFTSHPHKCWKITTTNLVSTDLISFCLFVSFNFGWWWWRWKANSMNSNNFLIISLYIYIYIYIYYFFYVDLLVYNHDYKSIFNGICDLFLEIFLSVLTSIFYSSNYLICCSH